MSSNSHSEKGQIYILMEDKMGQINPKTIREKIRLIGLKPVIVLKGGLFQKQEKQPEDNSKVALVSIDNPQQIVETSLKNIRAIPKDHAEMLLAVPLNDDRYDVMTNRDKLKKASLAKKGDLVSIDLENADPKGVLMYKGLIHKQKGVHFGVKLNKQYGDCDGSVSGIPHFTCDKGFGMYVPLHKINFLESWKNREDPEQKSINIKRSAVNTNVEMVGNLSVGVRVVIVPEKDTKENKDKIQRGVIRYLGRFDKFERDILAGVEMDNKVPRKMGNYHRGVKMFECPDYKAFVTPASALLREDQYDQKPEHILEPYEVRTTKGIEADEPLTRKKEPIKPAEFKPIIPIDEQFEIFKRLEERKLVDHNTASISDEKPLTRKKEQIEPVEFKPPIHPIDEQFEIFKRLKERKLVDHNTASISDEKPLTRKKEQIEPVEFKPPIHPIDEPVEIFKRLEERKLVDHNTASISDEKPLTRKKEQIKPVEFKPPIHPIDEPFEIFKRLEERKLVEHKTGSISDKRSRHDHGDLNNISSIGMPSASDNDDNQFRIRYHDNEINSLKIEIYGSIDQNDPSKINEYDISKERYDVDLLSKVPSSSSNHDPSLQLGSMTEVRIHSNVHYGVIRWKGIIEELFRYEMLAGLEMEDTIQSGTDGTMMGKRYFSCPAGRAFFVKLTHCKPDARFASLPSSLPYDDISSNSNSSMRESSIRMPLIPPIYMQNSAGPLKIDSCPTPVYQQPREPTTTMHDVLHFMEMMEKDLPMLQQKPLSASGRQSDDVGMQILNKLHKIKTQLKEHSTINYGVIQPKNVLSKEQLRLKLINMGKRNNLHI